MIPLLRPQHCSYHNMTDLTTSQLTKSMLSRNRDQFNLLGPVWRTKINWCRAADVAATKANHDGHYMYERR